VSDHLLILSDDETHLLGLIYSLGAMAVFAVKLGTDEERVLKEAQRLAAQVVEIGKTRDVLTGLRDRILELVMEADADAAKRKGV